MTIFGGTPSENPRAYTAEEVRDIFMRHVAGMVDYWTKLEGDYTAYERVSGMAFSMLTALDGCTMALPGFALVPSPHPEDKPYHIAEGENYFPEIPELPEGVELCDIGGAMHEVLYKYLEPYKPKPKPVRATVSDLPAGAELCGASDKNKTDGTQNVAGGEAGS